MKKIKFIVSWITRDGRFTSKKGKFDRCGLKEAVEDLRILEKLK